MIVTAEVFLRRIKRLTSRSEWAIRLLGLPRQSGGQGLVMVQIDGLSMTQFNRALHKGHVPFLKELLHKERYVLHSFYSGLPSNTPAVQGELMYGVKTCVPAFSYIPRAVGHPIKMFDSPYVEQFEPRLKEQGKGLLEGGSSYSNIYTGGAQEAHFCFGQMGWGGVKHALNPLVLPFLVLLYIDIFLRTFVLFAIELVLAVADFCRGVLAGRVFWKELEMIWLRSLVCVLLREFIVAGACMDIMRGLPVVHLNFLGYDEQAHCRGPSSAFAHWSMRGIDDAIKRIHDVIRKAPGREYDLWVYSDHGQEKTTPYVVKYGKTLEQAVQELFECPPPPPGPDSPFEQGTRRRARLLNAGKAPLAQASGSAASAEVVTTAMGPLGHVYVKQDLDAPRRAFYARKLVGEVKVPLVLTMAEGRDIQAWTPRGVFHFPQQAAEVFGAGHPFLEEMKEDLVRVCLHPDAGQFVIAGWSQGQEAISFPVEYGAHASMGPEETHAFALLPIDAPLKPGPKAYLRPLDLREAALRFLKGEAPGALPPAQKRPPRLRIMSYNVHGCLGMDGTISLERIARVIARYDPDIIALQELDAGRGRSGGVDQSERIARKLEMQHHFHPAFRWKDEQYGNAILSRYPMALMKMETLPKLAEKRRYEPRGALWVSVEFNGRQIQVINTHLSLWPRERVIQANALTGGQWLDHSDCAGPVILCGDFNAHPGSEPYCKVCGRLKDSQACLSGHSPSRTWFGRYPMGRIDHIFLSGDFEVNAVTVPRTRLEKTASDHLPLIVDVRLPPADAPVAF